MKFGFEVEQLLEQLCQQQLVQPCDVFMSNFEGRHFPDLPARILQEEEPSIPTEVKGRTLWLALP